MVLFDWPLIDFTSETFEQLQETFRQVHSTGRQLVQICTRLGKLRQCKAQRTRVLREWPQMHQCIKTSPASARRTVQLQSLGIRKDISSWYECLVSSLVRERFGESKRLQRLTSLIRDETSTECLLDHLCEATDACDDYATFPAKMRKAFRSYRIRHAIRP